MTNKYKKVKRAKKTKKAKRTTDRIFRELFMGLVTLAVMLIFILGSHLFLGVPLFSRALWGGSLLVYLTINLVYDVKGIVKKIIILSTGTILMGIVLNAVLSWPFIPSLLIGMVILILVSLFYATFLQ